MHFTVILKVSVTWHVAFWSIYARLRLNELNLYHHVQLHRPSGPSGQEDNYIPD